MTPVASRVRIEFARSIHFIIGAQAPFHRSYRPIPSDRQIHSIGSTDPFHRMTQTHPVNISAASAGAHFGHTSRTQPQHHTSSHAHFSHSYCQHAPRTHYGNLILTRRHPATLLHVPYTHQSCPVFCDFVQYHYLYFGWVPYVRQTHMFTPHSAQQQPSALPLQSYSHTFVIWLFPCAKIIVLCELFT